ncbi:MAG: Omp28-related outer membrane protein [Lentimicrobiaceae bacterium]|nr:Omp28-related outer membrane protein [Lentimicrobiaceae bacterium]
MKKQIVLALIFFTLLPSFLKAQEYVSTQPQNRNVIIEEFTGRNCQFCPDGHRIANLIMANNPGRVWAVNIHAGGYSPVTYPNMNTTDGTAITSGFGIGGFPAGHVNRSTAEDLGRNQWESHTNTQLAQQAEVNVAGFVTLNHATRTAEITVEVYYTANSSQSTNYLTIMMLQDSILGSQSGNYYNPSQMLNGQYVHQHVLRDVVTSTWGDEISPTTAGTLITKNYTYQIPESIGAPNGVNVDLNNILFLAFVTEKYDGTPTRPILNVCEIEGLEPIVYNAEICQGESYNENGFNFNNPAPGTYQDSYINEDGRTIILNLTVYPTHERNLQTSICEGNDFNYGVFHFEAPEAGVHTQEHVFSSVHGCDSLVIMTLTVHPSYEQEITAEICEGEDYKENGFNLTNLSAGTYNETLEFETDYDCDSIVNLTLTVHEAPIVDIEGNTTITQGESTTLTASGADSYVWSTGETTATITVSPEETTKYSVVGTTNGCEAESEITVNVTVGVSENDALNAKIYPNPTQGELNVRCTGMREITVFMPNGQTIEKINVNDDNYTLNMSNYKSGVYYLRITTENGTSIQKVLKD